MSDNETQSRDQVSGHPAPREVIFLFRATLPEALMETIKSFGAIARPYDVSASYPYWVYPSNSDRLLTFHLISDISEYEIELLADAFTDWWLPLKSALGAEPTVALKVYAVEGELAKSHLRRFATAALEAHDGFVQDYNSDHAWSLDEIKSGSLWNNRGCLQKEPDS